jgi:hypothetical protein
MAIELDGGAHLLAIEGRVTGKEREVTVLLDNESNNVRDAEKLVKEHVPDVGEYERADALLNKLRSQLKRFGTRVAPLGFITDPERAQAFKAETDTILEDIRLHNRGARFHRVIGESARSGTPDVLCEPIGSALDGAMAGRFCTRVQSELEALKIAVVAGDVASIAAWNTRCKSLAGLMPAFCGRAVQDAVDDAKRLILELREAIKAGGDPATVGAALDVSLIDTALALSVAAPVP